MCGTFGRIYYIKSPQSPFDSRYRVLHPHRYLAPWGALSRIIQMEKPDLIEICDKYSLPFLGGLLRIGLAPGLSFRPVIIGLSCERMDETISAYLGGGSLLRILARLYMRTIYFPLHDHHIAVSDHTAAELFPASKGHKVDRGVWIAQMGVDCERFTPHRKSAAYRRDLLARVGGGNERTVLLLYAGRIAREKNLPLLLNMMERLDTNCLLLLAGDGGMREIFQRDAEARLGSRVVFLGHISDPDTLADLYANTDVFIHPNPREPFGIAPLEAMSSGLPLVAPNTGGVTSYADDSNSWLCHADAGAFAAAVQQVMRDDKERDRRLAVARSTAMKFSWRVATARYLQLYRELSEQFGVDRLDWTLQPAFFSQK